MTVQQAAESPHWQVAERFDGAIPLVARFNTAYAKAGDRASYPIQLGVTLALNAPDRRGLPSPAEMSVLESAEDSLVRQTARSAVLVGVITTRRMRQFVLYSRGADWIGDFEAELDALVPSHSAHVVAKVDPEWGLYGEFVR